MSVLDFSCRGPKQTAHKVPGDAKLPLDGRSGAALFGSSLAPKAPSPEPLPTAPKVHCQDSNPNGAVLDSVQGDANNPVLFVVALHVGAVMGVPKGAVVGETMGIPSEFSMVVLEEDDVFGASARLSVAVLEMQASPELVAVEMQDDVVTEASMLSAATAFVVPES